MFDAITTVALLITVYLAVSALSKLVSYVQVFGAIKVKLVKFFF